MGIKRKKGEGVTGRQALTILLWVVFAILLLVPWMEAGERDPFRKVKEVVKKSGKPHYFTEALLDVGTSKQRILIVFIDATVADWQISYHPVDGASRVLFIFKPSLSRSIAFERWAVHDSK